MYHATPSRYLIGPLNGHGFFVIFISRVPGLLRSNSDGLGSLLGII